MDNLNSEVWSGQGTSFIDGFTSADGNRYITVEILPPDGIEAHEPLLIVNATDLRTGEELEPYYVHRSEADIQSVIKHAMVPDPEKNYFPLLEALIK